jgi:hypothetical protein
MDNSRIEQGKDSAFQKPEITKDGSVFRVTYPSVDLKSSQPPLEIPMEIEKLPTTAEMGAILHMIQIDHSPRYQQMIEEARAIQALPERERPRALVRLLRSQVQFAYPIKIQELEEKDPVLAERVKGIIDIRTEGVVDPLPLSEVIESGYGVCRHLAVAMLPLAQAAGLEGALCASNSGRIKNVIRKDTGQPLFKLYDIDSTTDPHVWVELRTSDGEWIPVDPATQLVGDNLESLATFQEANYRALTGFLNIKGFPAHVGWLDNDPSLEFLPGERTHNGMLKINTKETFALKKSPNGKIISQGFETNYKGPLSLDISAQPSRYSCNASIVSVASIK